MTRRRRRLRARLPRDPRWAALWLLVLLALALLARQYVPGEAPPATDTVQVLRVVDGDTLVLTNDERVRLIGADTPETVMPNHPVEPWGPEATEFTKRFVAGGPIRMEYDGPRTDKYGRTLAHVWVGDKLLEEELIRAGLATAETKYQYSAAMKTRLVEAESEAKAARRGIWSPKAPAEAPGSRL